MAAVMRSRLGLYGVVALFIIGITAAAVIGYRLYHDVLADTPEKASRAYMDTLNKGDMVKLYNLTRGASSQTQAEFAATIGALMKDKRLSFEGAVIEPVGRKGDIYYYRVMGRLPTADGSYRLLPLIMESGQEGGIWRVSIYLPPAVLAAGQ